MTPLHAAFAICILTTSARAETHDVKMFTRSERGPMIYEPDVLAIAPGDSVRFLPTQPGHNAATIDGMIPAAATPFKSQVNEDFTVTLTEPGLYGIKCSPHYAMGMVMLIEVGGQTDRILPDDLPDRARQRFETILEAQ
ncbi:pseudoazurin [Sedimentitalea sp. XS_ASV28]|uniref:pseudoazurin n=1 Tax=Sedimentitalea sp. XS_ASV28 TaxID=3241296 RepID=UPI0035121607